MAEEEKKEEVKEAPKASGKEPNIGMAVIAYFIFFLPLLTDSKNDPFVKFHVKQGLVILIAWVILMFANWILVFIPILGWLIMMVLWVGVFVVWLIGVINAAQGKKKALPLIGQFGEKFNF